MVEFQSFTPDFSLSKYIKCYWIIKGSNSEKYDKTILPYSEVCMTFIICKNGESYTNGTKLKSGVFISPPTTKKYGINIKEEFHFVDIAFYPGVFYELFKIPISEFENRVYNVEELGLKIDNSLLERLYNSKNNYATTVNILNNYFLGYFNNYFNDNMINNIKNLMLNANLEEFYSNCTLSTRQVQREIKKITGQSPRTIQRISRFYKILDHVKSIDSLNFSVLAHELDFYDQSHLIKEFKSFSGINLTNFMQLSSNYLQYQSDEYCHKHLSI